MKTKTVTLALALALCATSAMAALPMMPSGDDALAGWDQVAEGVFRHTDENGVTTQIAYGEAGARYDAARLAKQLDETMRSKAFARGDATAHNSSESIQAALAGISDSTLFAASVHPMTTDSGDLCSGNYRYAFDSTFYVGAVGATAISKVAFGIPDFGPPAPDPSYLYQYNSAQVVPSSGYGSTVTSTYSNSTGGAPTPALATWRFPFFGNGSINSSSCSGSTYAYINLNSTVCTGGSAFVSQTKTYSTCVNTP